MPTITALYAGLLGLLGFALAANVGRARVATGVSIGDGGDERVIAEMRRHANYVEYVPLCLILLALLELVGVGETALHALGATLFASRAAHAVGYGVTGPLGVLRTVGSIGTTLMLVVASVWAIVRFF